MDLWLLIALLLSFYFLVIPFPLSLFPLFLPLQLGVYQMQGDCDVHVLMNKSVCTVTAFGCLPHFSPLKPREEQNVAKSVMLAKLNYATKLRTDAKFGLMNLDIHLTIAVEILEVAFSKCQMPQGISAVVLWSSMLLIKYNL